MRPGEESSRVRALLTSFGVALLAVSSALASSATSLGAQMVRGRALSRIDSAGIPGVVVQLTTTSGTIAAQALSDQRGGFTIRAPAAGEYRLRALRIGFRPTAGESFAVNETGITERSIVLTGVAVKLAMTRVTAEERCAAESDPASLGFRAWEQARTALSASLVTRQSSTYEMHFVVAELRRAARSDSVIAYTEREAITSAMRPFTAFPLTRLRDSGYVTRDESGVTYAAPDEEVLLSEEFAVTHCIRAQPSAGDELVLTFEPTRDRTLSDVAGSLVLSRESGELRTLAYEYVNVPSEERAAHAGGELTFLRFPSGGWMVQRWVVRAPELQARERRVVSGAYGFGAAPLVTRRQAVVARYESRGEAFRVRQDGALVWAAPTAAIHGVVLDDDLGVPVPGTDVRIAGRPSGVVSDERGRFRLEGSRTGDVLLQITAPYALELGLPPVRMHLSVGAESSDVVLHVPSPERVIVEACRAASQPLSDSASRTIVRGTVRDAHGGRLGVTDVDVAWVHGAGPAIEMRQMRTRSTAFGDYVLCGVEPAKELSVRARIGGNVVASGKTILTPVMGWATLDLVPPPR